MAAFFSFSSSVFRLLFPFLSFFFPSVELSFRIGCLDYLAKRHAIPCTNPLYHFTLEIGLASIWLVVILVCVLG